MGFATRTACAAAICLIAGPSFDEVRNPLQAGETWPGLQSDIVGDRGISDGAKVIELDAPYRANDAATVPIHLRQLDPDTPVKSFKVVVDENPAPLAGEFLVGESMAPLDLELRVRVNQYSNIRVIADTGDALVMTGRFVKASGGCSAPATKDPEATLASMGQMRLRDFGPATQDLPQSRLPGERREAQIMIRHPNYSGFQRDQITHLFIAAHFIRELEVRQGEDLLFTMDGGISISENPVFRFEYTDNGSPDFNVRAVDTEGNVFERTLPKTGAGAG